MCVHGLFNFSVCVIGFEVDKLLALLRAACVTYKCGIKCHIAATFAKIAQSQLCKAKRRPAVYNYVEVRKLFIIASAVASSTECKVKGFTFMNLLIYLICGRNTTFDMQSMRAF